MYHTLILCTRKYIFFQYANSNWLQNERKKRNRLIFWCSSSLFYQRFWMPAYRKWQRHWKIQILWRRNCLRMYGRTFFRTGTFLFSEKRPEKNKRMWRILHAVLKYSGRHTRSGVHNNPRYCFSWRAGSCFKSRYIRKKMLLKARRTKIRRSFYSFKFFCGAHKNAPSLQKAGCRNV